MSVAGRTTTGKVWHVTIYARLGTRGGRVALCNRTTVPFSDMRPLTAVPAYQLCQRCERASEQIAAAIRVVQS